jgi:hypothetical protein
MPPLVKNVQNFTNLYEGDEACITLKEDKKNLSLFIDNLSFPYVSDKNKIGIDKEGFI